MFLNQIQEDISTIFNKDPAATSLLEVLFCYPGLHALILYRFSNFLYKNNIPFLPRFLSHVSRFLTGIEIHPGATIGKNFFIDHGMGVVIGETTIIGNDVLVYQGVTLGGTGNETGKRHPTILDNVVIGSGAKILGNITLGNNVRVGAGSVVVSDVPDDSTVTGIPGRVVMHRGHKIHQLQHNIIPDPIRDALNDLTLEIKELKQVIKKENVIVSSNSDNFQDGAGI